MKGTLVTFLVEVRDKRKVNYVIDLIKAEFGRSCESIDATMESEFAKIITVVLKPSVTANRYYDIRKEIWDWNLVNAINDALPDKEILKSVKKYCESFRVVSQSRTRERYTQSQLFSYLEAKLGSHFVKWERTDVDSRPDIVIQNRLKICVEVKVPKKKGELQRIFGQVNDYLKLSYKVIVLMIANATYDERRLQETRKDLLKLFPIYVVIR